MSLYLSSYVANRYIRSTLERSTDLYQDALEQLSSGCKFTSLGRNPVDVSKVANLEVEINFNKRIQSNIDIGVDMLSMTEEYQAKVISNLQRIRDLTLETANEIYTSENRNFILEEIRGCIDYINEIADSTSFNDTKILDGSAIGLNLKIGSSVSDNINVGSVLIDVHTDVLGISLDPAITGENWTIPQIESYLSSLDTASSLLSNNGAKLGSFINRLDVASGGLFAATEDLTEYKSVISDTDTAEVSANLVKYQIMQNVSTNIFVKADQLRKQMVYSLLNPS